MLNLYATYMLFKTENMIFQNFFVACDLKEGRYRQLIELMNLC